MAKVQIKSERITPFGGFFSSERVIGDSDLSPVLRRRTRYVGSAEPVPLTLLKQKTTEIKISSYRLLAYSC